MVILCFINRSVDQEHNILITMAVDIKALFAAKKEAAKTIPATMTYNQVIETLKGLDNVTIDTVKCVKVQYNENEVADNYLMYFDKPIIRVTKNKTVVGQQPTYSIGFSTSCYIHRLILSRAFEEKGMTKMAVAAAAGSDSVIAFLTDMKGEGKNPIQIDLLQRVMPAGAEQKNYLDGRVFTPTTDSVEYYIGDIHLPEELKPVIESNKEAHRVAILKQMEADLC